MNNNRLSKIVSDSLFDVDQAIHWSDLASAFDDSAAAFLRRCDMDSCTMEPLYEVDTKLEMPPGTDREYYGWITLVNVYTLAAAIRDEEGKNRFTRAEFERVMDWADKAAVNFRLLEGMRYGALSMIFGDDGELLFGAAENPGPGEGPSAGSDRGLAA